MVSVWWLLLAFLVGSYAGILVMAVSYAGILVMAVMAVAKDLRKQAVPAQVVRARHRALHAAHS
jgi:hypothetical protein